MTNQDHINAWQCLKDTLVEDIEALKTMVDNEDSACNARNLRRERMMALQYTLSLMETLEGWEW